MAADRGFRVRLEGGAEKLEVAALRYRALSGILDSLRWKERLAENGDLVDAVCEGHDEVLAVLGRARRILDTERSRELQKLVDKVSELISKTSALAFKRAELKGDLTAALRKLRADVAPMPSHDPRRWQTARAKLPATDADVVALGPLTDSLVAFATRPQPERVALPWTKAELPKLLAALAELDRLCARLWRRLGPKEEWALLQLVGRLSELTQDGPSALVRAESARRALRLRVDAALRPLFAPLRPSPHETTELLRWLGSGEDAPALTPASRASLFALAARLAEGAPKTDAQWERLSKLAAGADSADSRGVEAGDLLENLTLFVRIQQQKQGKPRAYPKTLSEALRMLRALSS